MYHIRYIHRALELAAFAAEEYNLEATRNYNPIGLSIGLFLINAIVMPIPIIIMLLTNRDELVRMYASSILEKFFGYEK